MLDAAQNIIVARFDRDAGQWVAYFAETPQVAFGGNMPMVSVRRLLEVTEATRDTYQLHRDSGRADDGLLVQSLTWEPPEILFDCTECKGTGQYVGLKETEPCKACGGRKVQTA